MSDRCEVPGCRGEVALIYLDHGVCDECWSRFTADDAPPDDLRRVLRIGTDGSAAEETEMATKKKTEATQTEPAAQPEAKPKATKARAKKQAATKEQPAAAEPAAVEAKPTDESKRARAKAPKEPLVVFAFRLTEAERDAIHKTAGPRNATQFVRRVAVAFAGEDENAFKTVITEARDLRR